MLIALLGAQDLLLSVWVTNLHYFYRLPPMNEKLSKLTKLTNIYIKYNTGFCNDKEHNIECKHSSFRSSTR
jgi:hypothetical protein